MKYIWTNFVGEYSLVVWTKVAITMEIHSSPPSPSNSRGRRSSGAPATLEGRLARAACCCGCDANVAVILVAVVTIVIYIIQFGLSLTKYNFSNNKQYIWCIRIACFVCVVCSAIGAVGAKKHRLYLSLLFYIFAVVQFLCTLILLLTFAVFAIVCFIFWSMRFLCPFLVLFQSTSKRRNQTLQFFASFVWFTQYCEASGHWTVLWIDTAFFPSPTLYLCVRECVVYGQIWIKNLVCIGNNDVIHTGAFNVWWWESCRCFVSSFWITFVDWTHCVWCGNRIGYMVCVFNQNILWYSWVVLYICCLWLETTVSLTNMHNICIYIYL